MLREIPNREEKVRSYTFLFGVSVDSYYDDDNHNNNYKSNGSDDEMIMIEIIIMNE